MIWFCTRTETCEVAKLHANSSKLGSKQPPMVFMQLRDTSCCRACISFLMLSVNRSDADLQKRKTKTNSHLA